MFQLRPSWGFEIEIGLKNWTVLFYQKIEQRTENCFSNWKSLTAAHKENYWLEFKPLKPNFRIGFTLEACIYKRYFRYRPRDLVGKNNPWYKKIIKLCNRDIGLIGSVFNWTLKRTNSRSMLAIKSVCNFFKTRREGNIFHIERVAKKERWRAKKGRLWKALQEKKGRFKNSTKNVLSKEL